MEREMILGFVRDMKPSDHVIFLYSNRKDKHEVLFACVDEGLAAGEAVTYVAAEENPMKIKSAMRRFGIDTEQHERTGALRVIEYKEYYLADGRFDPSKTLELQRNLFYEAQSKGFKGLRVISEMTWFLKSKMTNELAEYEKLTKEHTGAPVSAICAYDQELIAKKASVESVKLVFDLLKTHQTALIMGPRQTIVRTLESAQPQRTPSTKAQDCVDPERPKATNADNRNATGLW